METLNNNDSIFAYHNNFERISDVGYISIKESLKNISSFITIAIPTYKRVETLKDALESAINQIDFYDYDIVILDNNPERQDDTEIFINKYYSNEKNLTYIKNKSNLGMTGNWNMAFLLSQSKFVLLLHDDDILSPFYLANVSPFLTSHDVGMLKTDQFIWNTSYQVRPQFPQYVYNDNKFFKAVLGMVYNSFGKWTPSGIVLNRESVIKCGGYNEVYYPSVDYAFFANFIEKNNIYFLKKKLFTYRISVNASLKLDTQIKWITVDNKVKMDIRTKIHILKWLADIIGKKNLIIRYKAITEKYPNYKISIDGKELYRPSYLRLVIYKLIDVFSDLYWYHLYPFFMYNDNRGEKSD